ncbi:hypothetical protein GH5_03459 [Leishmania sp. Ghana 2012 LV757]|uniref:hypothetical protein n=1 Tax=Leishmania sp. Ghana 2012 LV757 TaxID=2803181 RepID=UPI001B60CB3E|nr:hypothetical protein GH5_03459 [Leishmania sp. Ghana 2012 LV757]
MERPKTESEIQQEQSDELFARQLQEQLNNPSLSENATPPPTGPLKSLQEAADAALARQLQEEIDRQEEAAAADASSAGTAARVPVECPACTFVNHIKPSSSSRHWKCAQCREPLKENVLHSSRTSDNDLVECKVCHSLNRPPSKKSDTVLCGRCYQELGASLSTAQPEESQANQRTVQLRCGQCNVINAVTVGADVKRIEFICGGCGVLNSIVLE